MRYLGSQMAAHHADPDPTAVQAITLHYLRVAREMGLADEVERLTRDPGAKYEPRAVLALLATDPPPPAAPNTPGESPPYDPRPLINVCDRFELMAELSSELLRRRRLHILYM